MTDRAKPVSSSLPDHSFAGARSAGLPSLGVWIDRVPRPDGGWHMALDEALLLTSSAPAIRFYQWEQEEITFGFFTPLASVVPRGVPATRRWTGGGVVEHGQDVTFSLAIPRDFLVALGSAETRYRWIHETLAQSLQAAGLESALASPSFPATATAPSERGLGKTPGACFSRPVAWDVIDSAIGHKIAGGAQRRTRAGLLHQGSVRLPGTLATLDHSWPGVFASRLGERVEPITEPDGAGFDLAENLRRERYRATAWHQRF